MAFVLLAALGAVEPEWAASFDTPDALYTWTAQKVDGAYADPQMRLVLMKAAGSSESDLNRLMPNGRQSLDSRSCIDMPAGGTVTPSSDATCYNLVFAEAVWQSLFKVDTSSSDHIVILAQHVPTEFEASAHYLKDKLGTDIEPVAEWTVPTTHPPIPWSTGVGAAILVNLMTLCGVIFLAPGLQVLVKRSEELFRAVSSAFASGALMAAAFYLLLYEATHLIAAGGEVEGAQTFKWGTMILVGFLTSMVVDLLCALALPQGHSPEATAANESVTDASANGGGKSGGDVELASVGVTVKGKLGASRAVRIRVLSGVLVGDFMHNLCDGIFMGTAFRFCNHALAWSVTLATVAHEIAQELSDFLVLTNPEQGGLKVITALTLNFVSGLSVLLGLIIVFAIDEISDPMVGMLLAFGGGVYLQIGASECMPRVYAGVEASVASRLYCIAAYVLGALAIGLVLLDHKHCSTGGHAH